MWVEHLYVDGLRCLRAFEISFERGLNVLIGANGVGKSSLLEALYLLGAGRSFRAGGKQALIAHERSCLTVSARVHVGERTHQVGFERRVNGWTARVDGASVEQLAVLARRHAVLVFEPGSHALISGVAEVRRRFLDWLVFHVEPNFASAHAAFQRVLKQRNALLRNAASASELEAWHSSVVAAGEQVCSLRASSLASFEAALREALAELLPELGACEFSSNPGWRIEESYETALRRTAMRDRALGYTTRGPQRADWSVRFDAAHDRSQLSRGQEKSLCFASVLALLRCFKQARGDAAILGLDDLFSELDVEHQARCLRLAAREAEQVIVTGVQSSPALAAWPAAQQMFHVERSAAGVTAKRQ